MTRILGGIARWGVCFLISFLAVVAILALTTGLPKRIQEWRLQADGAAAAAATLENASVALRKSAGDAVRQADEEVGGLRQASKSSLQMMERDIERRQKAAQARVLDDRRVAWAAARGRTDDVVASYRARFIELPLLERSDKLIKIRVSNLKVLQANLKRKRDIRAKVNWHNRYFAAYRKYVEDTAAIEADAKKEIRNPLCSNVAIPMICKRTLEIRRRSAAARKTWSDLIKSRQEIEAEVNILRRSRLFSERVEAGTQIVDKALIAMNREASNTAEKAEAFAWNKTRSALGRYGWQAFLIVLGGALVPVLHKAFAFWVMAPMASRTAPVRIRAPGPGLRSGLTGVAIDVPVDRMTELLVRSGVQDRSSEIEVSDKFVLKRRMFLTCIAAGLYNLQRFRSNRRDHVTVTGTDDDHFEVSLIDVPEGGAVVLQPRALLGVVKDRSRALRITRPWRLSRLISWMTFQFRYIVFHGPCTLIVQGRRGVRIKEAQQGRAINKRLVLGFDAGLAYGAARSGSFRPYLFGQSSLFDDRFSGEGSYIYEERSASHGKGSLWGRGLKGISDAVLSAFGI